MPIVNREDAVEVESRIGRIFAASSSARAGEIRALFVELLDFDPASGDVGLGAAPSNVTLPSSAEHIAELDGVHILYVALDTPESDRVRKGDAAAAARLISDQLGDDLLLVFTNTSSSQIHLIHPSFEGTQPTLRRMIVERDLPLRTAVQQVSNIYWNHQKSGSIRTAVDQTFDVEVVTKAFFEEYKRVFDLAMDTVEGFGDEKEEQECKKLFVQTLFNRLMFIYFLSRKGWLTFRGDNDYLNALWRDYQAASGDDKNFHVDRLRLLFFAGLNNYRAEDLTSEAESRRLIGEPPFLNGGLFDKTAEDDRFPLVPDECISEIFTKLFDRFNFTVMESTPFDIEVAVDPEMLGKVFEELVTGRHDTGSYYTPRPVVSFMCREALKGYLEGCGTSLAADEIASFVDERDTTGVGLAQAPRVAEALENVTVVDPACGSGAYLLGMMQELVDLRTALFDVGVDARSLYELKLHIIQRNLYGVDIDEFAVNIAMLRMWLSLVIEYEGDRPEPLPNLDFKVIKGDSLLGPDPSPDSYGDLFRFRAHSVAADLVDLKARHMDATTDKGALKEEIERVRGELRDALADTPAPAGAVDWRVEFAEVFDRGGFDVAIANPPYVNMVAMDRTNSEYRAALRSNYSTARGAFDIFVPFIERGMQVLSPNGLMAYITPNKLLAAEYAKTVRSLLVDKSQLLSITDLSDASIFTASVYPVIIISTRGGTSEVKNTVDVFRTTGEGADLSQVAYEYSASLSVALQFGNLWSPLLAQDAQELLPLLKNCERLGDIAVVSASATVDEAYKWKAAVIDEGRDLFRSFPHQYRPFIVSGNIRPYFHTWGKRPVQYIKHQYHSPVLDIANQVVKHKRRGQVKQEKLIISGLSKRLTCVYDQDGIAAGTSTVLVAAANAEDNAFICGLLNSDVMQRLYVAMFGSLSLAGGFLRFGTPQIRELPVPKSRKAERQEIADLVRQRAATDQENGVRYEHQINEAISALFGK